MIILQIKNPQAVNVIPLPVKITHDDKKQLQRKKSKAQTNRSTHNSKTFGTSYNYNYSLYLFDPFGLSPYGYHIQINKYIRKGSRLLICQKKPSKNCV